MRVLHVNDHAHFIGGVERILHDTARSLGENGEQGLLFTQAGSTPAFDAPFAWKGMSLDEALDVFRPDVAIVHKVDDAALISRVTSVVPTQVFVHDHDLTCPRRHKYVIGSDKPCNRKAGIACMGNLCFVERAPADDLIPVVLFDGIRRQRSQLAAARNASGFIVASEAMRQELADNGVDEACITVVPPIPLAADSITPRTAATQREILYVGQVIRGKGVDLLLRAVALLPADVTLTVVGEGNHLEECQALAASLGIESRVTFTGRVDHGELDHYYDNARLLAVPSRWPEPFGMVGIEAMARGRPVVAFDSGGISDWLADGETGFLVEPGNTRELARKMLKLLDDQHLGRRMGLAGLARVRNQFSHRGFIDRLCNVLGNTIHEDSDQCLCGG